jgi:hypothetical protein
MLAVGENKPVAGSYISADAKGLPAESVPLTTKTFPLGSTVTLGLIRAVPKLPVAVKVFVVGSYISTEDRATGPGPAPPTIKTLPSLNVTSW